MKEHERLELEVNQQLIMYDAWKRWGIRAQMDMLIEESSELIQAICKYYRYPNVVENVHKVLEEAADVQLCLNQLVDVLFPQLSINASKIFMEKYYEKLKRLEERVYRIEIDDGSNNLVDSDDSLAWH